MLHTESIGGDHGTVLFFLHGFMGRGEDWREPASSLPDQWRSVLVDLPGHGGSTRLEPAAYTWEGACGLVREVIEGCRSERTVLVGYSMGARIALQVAVSEPGLVGGVVVESGTAGLEDPAARRERLALDQDRAASMQSVPMEEYVRGWYRQELFATLASRRDLLEKMVVSRSRNDPGEVGRAMVGLSVANQPSLWGALAACDVPALVLSGGKDAKYRDLGGRIAGLMPRARAISIAGCGHNVHAEDPDAYLAELASFVGSLP